MAGDGDSLGEHVPIDRILAIVHERAGVDFSRYRLGTIRRRIANRMLGAGRTDGTDYLRLLEGSPDETWQLLDRLTIKVSRFSRNRAVFDVLRTQVLPALAQRDAPLRIWCAGCAHGEEAYSLALLLVRGGIAGSVLATDIDPRALARAAEGRYRTDVMDEFEPEEIAACFEPQPDADGFRRIAAPVRARVRFARHDLVASRPPTPGMFDLVSCRNVLIYLRPETQYAVTSMLTCALAPGGYLCLGESEWPPAALLEMLRPMPRQVRIFRKGGR